MGDKGRRKIRHLPREIPLRGRNSLVTREFFDDLRRALGEGWTTRQREGTLRTTRFFVFIPMPPEKKTKAEITAEYETLLKKYEELKGTAKIVYEPTSQELVSGSRAYARSGATEKFSALRTSVNALVQNIEAKVLGEAQRLEELQQAIELSAKHLDLHYHVQVAADALEKLVAEHEMKKRILEAGLAQQKIDSEAAIATRRREWLREQEELDYQAKLTRKRDQDVFNEKTVKREQALATREAALKSQEEDITRLRQQIGDIPKLLERELKGKEKEVGDRLRAEFAREKEAAKKEWESSKALQELRLKHDHEQLERYQVEISALREVAEQATKKAQDLAVAVIESGAGVTALPAKQAELGPQKELFAAPAFTDTSR